MSQYMRYFAAGALALDAIKKGLAAEDPGFKIDGGEVSRGGQLLAEIEINKPGSDLFDDEIAGTIQRLQQAGGHAQRVIAHVQGTQSVLAVQILDPGAMEQLTPLWTVLARLANGLWQVDGQGFYDQGQLVVPMA